jgi:AcrR family transcriptional regulator
MSTRDDLVLAAARLLDQGGPAAVTLRAVGQQVGLSHNAPYKHFADKEDLLAAVASRELRRPGPAIRPGDDPAAALKARAKAYVRWALRYPARFKLVFGAWTTASAELDEAASRSRGEFVDAVRAAQAVGGVPAGDPERVTALILALAHGAADLALGGHLSRAGKGHADPDDLVDDLFALMATAKDQG